MLSKVFLAALYFFGATVVTAGVQSSKPGCVDKCWVNTQYVSDCAGDVQCLCDDADFQNTVYQCLYTQCHTAQFGAALHHTLAMCSTHDAPAEDNSNDNSTRHTAPALIRQDNGRKMKRQYPMQSVSVSVSAMPTSRYMSVSASAYRGSPTTRAYGSPTGSPTGRAYGSPTANAYGKRR